jgi:hypothetical protein
LRRSEHEENIVLSDQPVLCTQKEAEIYYGKKKRYEGLLVMTRADAGVWSVTEVNCAGGVCSNMTEFEMKAGGGKNKKWKVYYR